MRKSYPKTGVNNKKRGGFSEGNNEGLTYLLKSIPS